MTPEELISKLQELKGYRTILVLCSGELYDIEPELMKEDKTIILQLNDF